MNGEETSLSSLRKAGYLDHNRRVTIIRGFLCQETLSHEVVNVMVVRDLSEPGNSEFGSFAFPEKDKFSSDTDVILAGSTFIGLIVASQKPSEAENPQETKPAASPITPPKTPPHTTSQPRWRCIIS